VIGCIFILSPAKADFCPFGHFDHLREHEQLLAFPPFCGANQVPKKAKAETCILSLSPMLPRKNGGVERGDLASTAKGFTLVSKR
jgi:hypothetical protein